MKNLLFASLILCLFCTCKKDNYSNLCGGSDPINNLPWLKAKVNTLETSGGHYMIKRGIFQSKTSFFMVNRCTNCNSVNQTFDCNGNDLKLTSEQYQFIYFSENSAFSQAETIWKN